MSTSYNPPPVLTARRRRSPSAATLGAVRSAAGALSAAEELTAEVQRMLSSGGQQRHDALTAVEHLEFAVDGGLIFNILEARYPDKDPIDRAGKALFDVFQVCARQYTS